MMRGIFLTFPLRSLLSLPFYRAAIAAISAGNDEEIGEMIADAVDKVGADGVLSIESSSSFETTVQVEEGMAVSGGESECG